MSEKVIQEQIDEINRKLDLLIDEVTVQRQNREAINDLVDDVAVIGKDVFRYTVEGLDNAGIELDSEALRFMVIKLIRNIENIGSVLDTLESINDLTKDLTPVIKQIGLDGIRKFHELEQKGYFEILNQLSVTADTLLSRYTRDDLQKLSERLIPLADTITILADPGVLEKINAIGTALRDIKTDEIEEYSVWRMMREMRKPEVKKSIGFIMSFLSVINQKSQNKNN